MRKNRYLALALTAVLAFSLAACGAKKDAGTSSSSMPQGSEGPASSGQSAPKNASEGQSAPVGSQGTASTSAQGARPAAGGGEEAITIDAGKFAFEVPASWREADEQSKPESNPAIYFFIAQEANIADYPSNMVAEIHPATQFSDDKNAYADQKSQDSFWEYIEKAVLPNISGVKNVEYSAIEEEDRYLYVVEYDREAEGETVHQSCYYAMGFDVPIVFYATEYGDAYGADVQEVARLAAASFRIV